MCSHVDWTQLNVLQKLLVLLFSMIYFSKCPAGTCDGCTFYFLWESVEACPLCTERDFHEIEGACKRGFQVSGKLLNRAVSLKMLLFSPESLTS